MDDAAAVSEVLDKRPELEDSLRAVLDVDDANEAWTFDDLPIDSGAFGELVSRGLVERTDDGNAYRLADPDAVRSALRGDAPATADPSDVGTGGDVLDVSLDADALITRFAAIDGRAVGAVIAGILAVVLVRVHAYSSVFRDDGVVLSANDPYYYRYWVEQALAESGGALDVSSLSTVSDAIQVGEPLLVATLWFFSSLLGGTPESAGLVLAWYPVFAAAVTGLLVYLLAMRVTEDRRVALAALALLAITPAHAMRTSLGFADHHAFDYVWLLVTAYALVRVEIKAKVRNSHHWAWAAILGVGIAGQILAWNAGPLLVVPLGIYVAFRVLDDVRTVTQPVPEHLPLIGGVALAAVLVSFAHLQIGWLSGTVAFTPVLLLLGVGGVLAVGEFAVRYDVGPRTVLLVEAVGAVGGLVALRTFRPEYWGNLMAGVGRLTATRDIAETQSLLSSGAFGWLLLFGFLLVLALPYLVWGSVRAARSERSWLVPTVYCWYFFALAVLQVRFAGQLAMFASVFAGLGFVHIAERVDLTESPVPFNRGPDAWKAVSLPDARTIGYVVVLFVLVGSLSIVQVPVKTSQVTTDGDAYNSAAWIADYADERGLEYPENYVLSEWSTNRMYNYFVNGESQAYTYARNTYDVFLTSTNGTDWYSEYEGRVGFIVTEDGEFGPRTIHEQLHDNNGSQTSVSEVLEHYRALYWNKDRSLKVFEVVPGAIITGTAPANTSFEVTVRPTNEGGTVTYTRTVEVDQYGIFEFTVPYAGEYDLGSATARVNETAILRGDRMALFEGPAEHAWSFDEGSGDTVYDRSGGHHGTLQGPEWTEGVNDSALRFDGKDSVSIPPVEYGDGQTWTASMWVTPDSQDDEQVLLSNGDITGQYIMLSKKSFVVFRDENGQYSQVGLSETYNDRRFHLVVTADEQGYLHVYENGTYRGRMKPNSTAITFRSIGLADGRPFGGMMDEVRLYDHNLSRTDVRRIHGNVTE